MRRLSLAFALALLGCAEAADPTLSVTQIVPVRDMSAPIASQVDVTAARLSGRWFAVQSYRQGSIGPTPGTEIILTPSTNGGLLLQSRQANCDESPCSEEPFSVSLVPAGPGRWEGSGAGWLAGGPIWVLWMDGDDRTAVIGRPDGLTAWIMDRNSAGSPDRVAAGRDILVWFGYDVARLEEVSR